jgi:hypothetical protein
MSFSRGTRTGSSKFISQYMNWTSGAGMNWLYWMYGNDLGSRR